MSRDAPVLILGGGINGAAIARELLLQGRGVILVEQGDLAGGATAYSSRLIHGGLRYLEYGEFALVRESLRERGLLLANAPEYVRPLRFFIPVQRLTSGLVAAAGKFLRLPFKFKPRPRGLLVVRSGLWLYDRFAQAPSDAAENYVSLPGARSHRLEDPVAPRVERKGTLGFCSYSDAQVQFPERFTIGLLRDAAQIARERGLPFAVHTYTRCRLENATAVCEPLHPAARPPEPFAPAAVINATGAWVDLTLERLQVPAERLMGGTKGSHFFTWHPELREQLRDSAVYAEAADGRPVFVLPFGERGTLVGTTDLPFTGDPGAAVATEEELEYLLSVVRTLFPQITIDRDDITLHGCGVRPLPFAGKKTPAAVTRRHWLVFQDAAPLPLLSVVGGKLTTCRSLAEETAAAVLNRLGVEFTPGLSKSRPLPPEPPRPSPAHLTAENLQPFLAAEFATTLEDVVERRLMWLYEPELDRSQVESVAALRGDTASDVQRCLERLAKHFGRET